MHGGREESPVGALGHAQFVLYLGRGQVAGQTQLEDAAAPRVVDRLDHLQSEPYAVQLADAILWQLVGHAAAMC